ncbi:MAG: YhcH/YjgK/YiaL family protein [Rikenellaceae bacterium]|nr:YhcH/YjgK/YiaL family protein [Rikenellaceae bacterium]
MILDSLKNSGLYEGLNPLFAKAFEFIRTADFSALPGGVSEIEGKDLYVNMIHEGKLKLPENAPLEVHDKYIDIQVLLEGEETYGWAERGECAGPRGEMNTEKDVLLFDGKSSLTFTIKAGEFCIFFPSDGHAPMIGDPARTVKKCIVKVRV